MNLKMLFMATCLFYFVPLSEIVAAVTTASTNISPKTGYIIQCKRSIIDMTNLVSIQLPANNPQSCPSGHVPVGLTRTDLGLTNTSQWWMTNLSHDENNHTYTKYYYSTGFITYGSGQPTITLQCAPIVVQFQPGACPT